ncbi:integrase [Microbacterium marinum]|uniref:Integrase n=1 Tax=Microbacterium marinum TaxID=421115 RepID=A0A7W7BQR4_9MICO|nr:site-specific integrase [Microbacterium marinum]MBB4667109.1 integrase [Microbacterium marinum]
MAQKEQRKRSSAWGTIRALPSGRFQARYIGADGKQYSAKTAQGVSLTFGTRTDARAWLNKKQREIADGSWETPEESVKRRVREAEQAKAHRFATYAESWISERRNKRGEPLSVKTAYDYRLQVKNGLACFADDSITEITAARVRAWHAERSAKAATAAGNEARLLRAIMNTAIIDEIITKNPVDSALAMSKTGIKHRPPTMAELATMLEAIEPRFKLAILLGAYGGLRLSEWRALRRCDLRKEGERYVVHVHRQAQHVSSQGWVVGKLKGKDDDVEREVSLPIAATPDVEEHLRAHVGRARTALLFAPGEGSEFLHNAQWNSRWNQAREAAGLRVRTEDGWESISREHDLRAFAGTMHAQTGATLRETMAFLGHSTTVAAMTYQKTTGRDAELADRMPFPASSSGTKGS